MSNSLKNSEKKKALAPKLRFKEFDSNWEFSRLREFSKLITKGTTPQYFSTNGINYIKIEGLVGIKIDKDKCLYIDEETHNKELRRSILQKDDILFAIAGATIGKVAVVTEEILPANTNQALAIVRLNNRDNLGYMLQILQSRVMKKYIKESISVGAQPNLNLEQIGEFQFHIPTLPEQQKIASFLSAIDEKIQQLTRKKELLEQYKKGVMQQLFSGKLKFKDENGKAFPKWEEKRLGEVAQIRSGLSKEQNENGNYKVTRIETISSGVINIDKVGFVDSVSGFEDYKLKMGDILFSNINSVSHIGKTAIAKTDLDIYHGMNLLCFKSSVASTLNFYFTF